MSAHSQDLFPDSAGAGPAVVGSYGEAPRGYRLPEGLRLGAVRVQVADLARSLEYYTQVLGLTLLGREGAVARLGAADGTPLLELNERAGVIPKPSRGRTGLFHFAILLPDRPSLGRFVSHLGELGVQAGAGDHLVSEAFYLTDPDGLGIEIYADRPRESWQRVGRELRMATDPVDVAEVVRAAGDTRWNGMPAGTRMGHVHLHVGDVARASAFYSDALGFDRIVWSYPGALFFSAGGYHHHLGTNTWAGSGAKPAMEHEAQLVEWTVELPLASDVDAAAASLTASAFPFERAGNAIVARDPWGTTVRIRAREG